MLWVLNFAWVQNISREDAETRRLDSMQIYNVALCLNGSRFWLKPIAVIHHPLAEATAMNLE
jgi:hypothetical protein